MEGYWIGPGSNRPTAKIEGWRRTLLFGLSALLLALSLLPWIAKSLLAPLVAEGEGAFSQSTFEDHLLDEIFTWGIPASCAIGVALLIVSVVLSGPGNAGPAKIGFSVVLICILLWFFSLVLRPAREKPVIYLYPQSEQQVNVRLRYDGRFLRTDPEYSEDGWTVIASPSGELIDVRTGKRHEYLFWEGVDAYRYAPRAGFVVEGRHTEEFLESTLYKLGLSERETNDFIAYWLPRMAKNRYNVVHFATDEYDRHVPIEIQPAPDTVIRVFMIFKAVDTPVTIPPQELKRVSRQGFTVVEWGGTELR